MSLLEKFFKKQKEPVEEEISQKEEPEPEILRRKITIRHAQQILEDGKIYDTGKSAEFFPRFFCSMNDIDVKRAYFLAPNGETFSAEQDRVSGFSLCDGGKVQETIISYHDLRIEPEGRRRYFEYSKVNEKFPKK